MKKVFEWLASLKLAVILLVLILVGLSAGTILEARAGAGIAGRLVYYSGWFLGLQGLLAINLAMSLADLFPWARKRAGFVVVHASLILILAGACFTYFLKVEGTLGLWEGDSGSVIEQTDPQGKVLSRHQLPFSVRLEDFRLSTYPGTMRPAGFMSRVQVTDTASGRTFPAEISMNHELRFRGFALFQSSYQQDGGREATVLAVSKDPGQAIAFAGFITLIAGMCIVLGTRITQAMERAALEAKAAPAGKGSRPAKGSGRAARALLLGLLLLGGAAVQATPLADLVRAMPVQHDGRTMPFDTLARELVWKVTGAHAWKGQDPAATATDWLVDPSSAADAPVLRLGSKALAQALGLPGSTTHASFNQLVQIPALMKLMQAAQEAEARQQPRKGVQLDAEKLGERIRTLRAFLAQQTVRPIPVPGDPGATWGPLPSATPDGLTALMTGPRLQGWPGAGRMSQEVFYNRLDPARLSWIILLAALVLSVFAWVRKLPVLDTVAFVVLAGGFSMMTWGIGLRWLVGGRIPAANMYESMLFLAWGVGLFALIAYTVLKNRLVLVNAAVMATLAMALTDLLPIDRFIHPIAPVLAGTPWLAIHVPIIMVSYSILALGLVVAHVQIGFTIFAPARTEVIERMHELNYWYMLVGSIFLIAGIITGSMWAASSWGRYWGWDPKEVWSLVAFLAYMAILHARLDRMIGMFGVAAISIIAFQTILMTYLGVNFVLTTGMHSYGMGDSPVLSWMAGTALAEAVFLAWGTTAYRRHSAGIRR